jgi:hypothetical protein
MRGTVGLLDSVTHAMIPLRLNWPRNRNSRFEARLPLASGSRFVNSFGPKEDAGARLAAGLPLRPPKP